MNLTSYQIISVLDRLGIEHENKPNYKNWLLCKCLNPHHHDKVMSNAGINLNTGVFNCFACNKSSHITEIVKQHLNCSYDEALVFIKEGFKTIKNKTNENFFQLKTKTEKRKKVPFDFITIPLIPENYIYTKSRGFTKEFCEEFNILQCISYDYLDYFIIPILDNKKNIEIFEARKLMEYVYLKRYYNSKSTYKRLKIKFKFEKIVNKYKYRKGEVFDKNNCKVHNIDLIYLMQPKVLYPFNTVIEQTLWNIDNLDRSKPLWICEGLGTIPKVYLNVTKNITSVFGTKISKEQIEYLKEFKEIIVIPDWDKASIEMIKLLYNELQKVNICCVKTDDTEDSFVDDLLKSDIIKSNEFLIKYDKNFSIFC